MSDEENRGTVLVFYETSKKQRDVYIVPKNNDDKRSISYAL
jgi:hypothetical protein